MDLTTRVIPSPIPSGLIRDAKDDIILATAVGGKATHIVSGDKDLIVLANYEGIYILMPAQFLVILEVPSSSEPLAPLE